MYSGCLVGFFGRMSRQERRVDKDSRTAGPREAATRGRWAFSKSVLKLRWGDVEGRVISSPKRKRETPTAPVAVSSYTVAYWSALTDYPSHHGLGKVAGESATAQRCKRKEHGSQQ
jgi:hypothetical protein